MADAIAAHDEALKYGGRSGIGSLDLIESAIARPYSGYHRTISQKSAALLESVVSNHGFIDGNKRTALLLVELLVDRSGYVLEEKTNERIDDIIVDVAAGNMSFDELEPWFRDRLKRQAQL